LVEQCSSKYRKAAPKGVIRGDFFVARIYRCAVNSEEQPDITGMLAAWSRGDETALRDVMPVIYGDLRLIARKHLAWSQGQSFQSGTLAH
jgi:hypothetical protein